LRRFNERIVCVAMTGFGLDGATTRRRLRHPSGDGCRGDDWAIPTAPRHCPAIRQPTNSTGLAAALGLLAQIVRAAAAKWT